MTSLSSKIRKGDARAIARLITQVENNDEAAIPVMKELHADTGQAHVVGITGVMGGGKSSLIFELADRCRKQGRKVGIIAIDPTSPFSGGALLGDRVRMMELSTDENVFIRSMGTRGTAGGLTGAVYDVIEILDAAGMDIIFVETVGVGQDQVDICRVADTTLVVLVPGLGDSVQMIKAGLMEIADVYVVNKADLSGVERTIAELESLVELSSSCQWKTNVLATSVKKQEGIESLLKSIDDHLLHLKTNKLFAEKRRKRYEAELVEIIHRRLMCFIFDEAKLRNKVDTLLDEILHKKQDPYSAAEQILGKILK